jgi:hypothetical protein
MLNSIRANELIKLFNSLNFEYTWEFWKGISKSVPDDIKFRKFLKKSFKKNYYYEDRKSIKNIYNYK